MIFDEPPDDFDPKLQVVGGFLEWDRRILLLLRHKDKPHGGTWAVPAGKVELGETPAQAMCREMREETGVGLGEADFSFFKSVYVRHNGADFVYHMFHTSFLDCPEIGLSADEHTEFLWASPRQALDMPLIHDEDACIRAFYFPDDVSSSAA